MEIRFKSRKLERVLVDSKEMLRTFGSRAKKIGQRMAELRAAANLEVMKSLPAANCHQLYADRDEEFAVDISVNYRMIFEITHNPIPRKADGGVDCSQITTVTIIEIKDYHRG
jgi:plasmid maintenance system killer protein